MSDPDKRPPGPRNVVAASPFLINAIDIYWDDPRWLPAMDEFEIVGHRVYRSAESPEANFELISGDTTLISRNFRDRTEIQRIHREEVTSRFVSKGDNERKEYFFLVRKAPIVVPNSQLLDEQHVDNVVVEILKSGNQLHLAKLGKVLGDTGEVHIETRRYLDLESNQLQDPVLPDFTAGDKIYCTYYYGSRIVQVAFNRPYYYRVTTVARRKSDGRIVETRLPDTNVASNLQLDSKDYIWARANDYNQWVLEQAGEKNLFLLRKRSGERCSCFDGVHGRGRFDCPECYGTGYVGGYEGPFEAWCTPFEANKSLSHTDPGLALDMTYDLTILDPFLLNPGDLMVRRDGQRFEIQNTNPIGPRGTIRVQSASVSRMQESDYRHRIPLHPTQTKLSAPLEVDAGRQPDILKPIITDSPHQGDDSEKKGRTIVFGNIQQERL